jgi:hypothetical protein
MDAEQILREQSVSDREPGPVLHDVEVLLDELGEEGLRVSAKKHVISGSALPEINERFAYSTDADYSRYSYKAFPYVFGVYLLLRASGLARIDRTSSKDRLVRDEEVLDSWRDLNRTEQYVSLLAVWLGRADDESLVDGRRLTAPIIRIASFLQNQVDDGEATYASPSDRERVKYYPGEANIALLHLFGLADLEEDGTASGEPWRLQRVQLRPFGHALFHVLFGEFASRDVKDLGFMSFGRTVDPEFFHDLLKERFPDVDRFLTLPEEEFRPGVHVFTAELQRGGRFSARVALPGSAVLDDLSDLILDAIGFDRDHLYQFTIQRQRGGETHYDAPRGMMVEAPYTDEARIGDLPLEQGDAMTYLYDFGDNWKFSVVLREVDDSDDAPAEPTILSTYGEAPEQYPLYGED